jgi:fatty acid/phospholipid biosynthesis enzyme
LLNLKKDEKLVGIFNMACDNHKEVAYKLAIIANKEKFANLYLILVGEKEEIEPFLKETHLNYPYKRYNFFEFI